MSDNILPATQPSVKNTAHSTILGRFTPPTRRPQVIPAGMKTVYLDEATWLELAQARGLKLPNTMTPPTSGKITHWCHRLGLTGHQFTAWCGYTPSQWIAHNPTWSLRALVGLLLEDFASEAV